MRAWVPSGKPFRLVEREPDSDEEDPKALACYGVYLPMNSTEEDSAEGGKSTEENAESDMLLRFAQGRPVSGVTTTFLEWVCERLDQRGTDVWALIWDQASWHVSHEVRGWIHEHNKQVEKEGRSSDSCLRVALEKPVAQPHRAKVALRQASHLRARWDTDSGGHCRARSCVLRLCSGDPYSKRNRLRPH